MVDFVGRDEEWIEVERALSAASNGDGRLVLFSGEPGIGKSRFAEETSRRAEGAGFTVAWGRSWEAEGTPAYWPWLEILRTLCEAPGTAEIMRQRMAEAPDLEALLEGGKGAPVVDDVAAARFLICNAVATVLRGCASQTSLLLVLDDLHVADAPSLELLLFVVRALRGARMLVVGTTRPCAFAGAPAIAALLGKTAREGREIALPRMSLDDISRWVKLAAPALLPSAQHVLESSEGIPLFVEQLLATWRKEPERQFLPLGIRDVIHAHLDRIGEPARRLLEVASILGREAPVGTLCAMAVEVDCDSEACIDEALAAAIVTRTKDGNLRFSHVLVRDELYAHVPQARRSKLHFSAALRFFEDPSHIALAAHHVLLGASAAAPDVAVDVVLGAMREASGRYAFAEVAALGERAMKLFSGRLRPEREGALLIHVGEALILSGELDGGRHACRRAAERGEEAHDASLIARAALAFSVDQRLGRDPERIRLLRRAAEALPCEDRPLRAQVLSRLSFALVPPTPEERDEPLRVAREAVAMARRLGDEESVLSMLAVTMSFPEQFEVSERLSLNAEIIAMGERVGRMAHVAPAVSWQVATWIELGRFDAATVELEVAEKRMAGLPAHYRWRAELSRALLATIAGRFGEARTRAREVARACQASGHLEGLLHACIHLVGLPYVSGDADDYAEDDPLVMRTFSARPGSRLFWSYCDAVCGRIDQVREAMALAKTLDLSSVAGSACFGWAVAIAGLTEDAAFFYELARARAVRGPIEFGPGGLATHGPVDLLAGRLAHMAGRKEEAIAHLERSFSYSKQLTSPPFIAQTELALAEVLAHERASEARAYAQSARETAESLGMGAVAQRAREIAERFPPSRTPTRIAAGAPFFIIERRGEMWALSTERGEMLIRETRGMHYLDTLLRAPHRDIHVLELVGVGEQADAGPVLDQRAKRAYRARAEELRETLGEATRNDDLGHATRARAELDALARELARAVGLDGRDKRAASTAQRARINVQRRLRDVIRRVNEQDTNLGRHLELSVRTGTFCRYAPTWPAAEGA
jgi:tetratricopeptide (TPR) repeat protein